MPTSANPTTRQVNIKNYADMFALFLVLAGTSVFLTFDAAGNRRSINGDKEFFLADISVSEVFTFGAFLGVVEQLFLSGIARCNQYNEISFEGRAANVLSLASAFFMFAAADQLLQRAAPELNGYPKGEIAAFIGSATLATVNNMINKTLTLRAFGLDTLKAFAAFGTFVTVNSAMADNGQPVQALSSAGVGVSFQALARNVIENTINRAEPVAILNTASGDEEAGDAQAASPASYHSLEDEPNRCPCSIM